MNAPTRCDTFALLPFPQEAVSRFRNGADDWGQPITRIAHARGGEPLRDQLRRAREGESILLAAFSPFSLHNPYREVGPVFLSAELPAPDSARMGEYFRGTTAIRAYDSEQRIHAAVLVPRDEIEAQVARYFEDPEVWFVDARFAAHGCFACRYVRTDSSAHSS